MDHYTQAHEAPAFGMGLLSWPPSPPGTAQSSGRRRHTPVPRGLPIASAATPRAALVFLYALIVSVAAICGQALAVVIAYLLPHACDDPLHSRRGGGHLGQRNAVAITFYAIMTTLMIACLVLVAEVVGIIPTKYADYHLLSCLTRCCLHSRRKKWSRLSNSEQVPTGYANMYVIHGMPYNVYGQQPPQPQQQGGAQILDIADVPGPTEAHGHAEGQHPSSSRLCAWLAWATAASAVTAAGTAIWVLTGVRDWSSPCTFASDQLNLDASSHYG